MAEPISEDLGFDISGALQGIGQIDDALQQVIQSFSVGLATALEQLIGVGADVTPLAESLDVAGLGPAIDTALTDAQSGITVPVEADTSAVGPEIADAVDQPQTVPVDADTADAQTAIADLDQPVTLPVDADTGPAQAAVDEVAAAPITVPVDADTTDAETAIGALEVTPQTIPVDADTSQAADAIAALGTETPVTVPVDGDVSGLSDAIETATTVTPVIPVDADVTDAQAQIDALAAVPVDVPVAADTTVAQDAIDQLGLAAPIDIPVSADTAQAETDIAQLGGDVTVPVDADTAEAEAQIAGLGDPITVPVEGDTADLSDAIDTATSVSATIPVDADTSQAEQSIEALATVPTVDVPVSADTAGAEAEIEQLGLGVSVDVPVTADTSAAEGEIAGLGAGVEVSVPVDADTSALSDAIDNAASVSPVVAVEGDAAGLTEAIDTATAVSPVIDVGADTSEAQAAIDALNVAPVTVDVDADTSQAQDQLDALGASATSATGGGGSGLAGLEGAVLGVKAATGAATGDVSGLTGVVGGLSSGLGEAVVGGAAFTAFLGETVKLAADAQAQQARFNATFGESAKIVQNIDVGGLRVSLKDLGEQTGTLNADLENSATRIGLLGAASGAAQPEVAKTASNLLGLAGALAASNPRFGDAATVADVFSRALSTGRTRSLIPYGVSLSQTAIQQEALKENTDKTKDTLTGYDKLVAGLTLALQQQGDTLGTKYAQGIQGAGIQLRALKVQLEETLTAIGGPLLQPVVESLKSLLPVAQAVGEVLGNVAQIVVPAFAALAPALTALTGPLHLVSEGLGAISLLPGPLAVGLGLVGFALITDTPLFYLAAAGVEAFGAALTVATGPIGIAVAALAAIGFVFSQVREDLSGGPFVPLDTSKLTAGFDASTKSAAALSDAFGGLNESTQAYLQTQLSTGDAGERGIDAANRLGLSTKDLARILNGTTDEYNRFIDSNRIYGLGLKDNDKAGRNFIGTILESRIQLEASARSAISAAVASGSLTIEQAKLAIATTAAADAGVTQDSDTHDYISALRELQPLIDQATVAQQNQTFATFAGSQASKDLAASIALGTVKLADAQQVATDNNITVEQATTLITRQEQAMLRSSIATGRFTQGFLDLKPAIADGSITINDAQAVADELGISFDDAKAAVDSLSTAMDQFVTQGLSALPSAGAAIDDFASGISSAKSALDQALSATPDNSGADAVARAQESANQSIADSAEKNARTVANSAEKQARTLAAAAEKQAQAIALAEQKVRDAQAGVDQAWKDTSAHQAQTVAAANAKLLTAQQELARAQEKAGNAQADALEKSGQTQSDAIERANQSQADAVRSGSEKVSAAQDAANQSQKDAAQKVKDAQDAYLAAINPQRVIDAQNAQTFAILAFQGSIDTLIRRNRLNIAAQLIAEGPIKGGQLAAALVSDDALAQAADRGAQLGTKIRVGYREDLENNKAELSGILVTLADGSVVPLSDTFDRAGKKSGHAYVGGVAQAINASAEVKDATRRLIEGGAAAFDPNLAASPAKAAGELAGKDAQTGFAQNFQPDEAATTAIGKVPAAITNGLGPINNAAAAAGDQIAERFHPNFAAQILPAMLTVLTSIDQGVTDVKPFVELEGQALGKSFGDGFALGLVASSPDVTAVAGALGTAAEKELRKKIQGNSPSLVAKSIGEDFVAGLVQGLEQLDPLHRATAALALALVPDLRPALRQAPSLAPAISAAASHAVAAPAVVSTPPGATAGTTRKEVNVRLDVHKVDVNEKHLADEIAWMVEG